MNPYLWNYLIKVWELKKQTATVVEYENIDDKDIVITTKEEIPN